MCRPGHQNLCPTVQFAGHGTLDGAMQEQLLWPDHLLHPLPDELSDEAGALLEPLGVAIHAVGLSHLRPGCGRAGRRRRTHRGARGRRWPASPAPAGVFVVEPLEHRRATALRNGADARLGTRARRRTRSLEATGGRGVDVVIEMAGTDAAIDDRGGGHPARRPDRARRHSRPRTRSSFPAATARRKGLTFAMVRRMNATYPRAIALASGGDRPRIAGHRTPSAESRPRRPSAAAAERHGDKVVVTVSSV